MSDIIPGCMKTLDWSVETLDRECNLFRDYIYSGCTMVVIRPG
jgi:hypothetical protein